MTQTQEKPMFKIGDIVRLKSGGPKMTVTAPVITVGCKEVSCAWFVNGVRNFGNFPTDSIVHVKAKEPRLSPDPQYAYDSLLKLYRKGSLDIGAILELFNIDPKEVKKRVQDEYAVSECICGKGLTGLTGCEDKCSFHHGKPADKVFGTDPASIAEGQGRPFRVEVIDTQGDGSFSTRLEDRLNLIKRFGYSELHLIPIAGSLPCVAIAYLPV